MEQSRLNELRISNPDLYVEAERLRDQWKKTERHMGPLYPNDTVLVIEFDNECAGLGDYFRAVNGYLLLADLFEWIPVVHLNGLNQYLQSPTDNMWEYYFEPVSEVSASQATQCANVVFGSENDFGIEHFFNNTLTQKLAYAQISERIRIRRDLLEKWKQLLPKELEEPDLPVMGMVARGTDLAVMYNQKIDVDAIIRKAKDVFEEKRYAYLFLATEDASYLQSFQNAFRDKLLFVDQTRVFYQTNADGYGPFLNRMLEKESIDMRAFGERYLMIVWFLAHCREIYTTFHCGASYMASFLAKPTVPVHELLSRINTKKRREKMLSVERDQRCAFAAALVKKHGIRIIYGTGEDSLRLWSMLEDTKDILFCDRKAEEGFRSFNGRPVITQEELITKYRNEHVLIMTLAYESQIRKQLVARGFPESGIFLPRQPIK